MHITTRLQHAVACFERIKRKNAKYGELKIDTLKFENVLRQAINGSHEDIEIILKLYAPLIDRQSYLNGKFDEDLRQYILMHVIKNISKFRS